MTASDARRWQRVNELFHEALEQPPETRTDFLQQACAGDRDLHEEVTSLLASHERATSFLEMPAIVADPGAVAPPAARSLTGRQIGPYLVGQKIGQGGMGVVYVAEDSRLRRRVALKALAPEFTSDDRRRERLRREARTAASLSHPGIATVYALEELDGDLFIVSEYVQGRTLREVLASGPLPSAALLQLAVEIARALAAAHEQGVIHRDLKPENIIRSDDGTVKILDFGLARFERSPGMPSLTHLTEAGMILGTPAYMSPEQLRGRPLDFRTDIFSFGVLLYEAAAGVHPFAGSDTASTIVRVLESEPLDLSDRNPLAPADLDRIIRVCLQKDPAARYERTRHLAEDLEALNANLAGAMPMPPGRRSGPTAGYRREALWWWQFHQLAVAVIYYGMLYPMWIVRGWAPRPIGSLLFAVILVAVGVAATLRIHLWFTSRVYLGELQQQRAQLGRWIWGFDLMFTVLLAAAGLALLELHAAMATLLLSVGVASFLASTVIERATSRAAFGERPLP